MHTMHIFNRPKLQLKIKYVKTEQGAYTQQTNDTL